MSRNRPAARHLLRVQEDGHPALPILQGEKGQDGVLQEHSQETHPEHPLSIFLQEPKSLLHSQTKGTALTRRERQEEERRGMLQVRSEGTPLLQLSLEEPGHQAQDASSCLGDDTRRES